ncbi:MAG: diphthine--ammonia ligase [Thermoplasmataceae archaeon]
MRSFALFSGGKDSFLSVTIAIEQGFEVETNLTIIPEEFSMMFQYPNVENSRFASGLLGIQTEYRKESDFPVIFREFSEKGYRACVAGAVESEYQKTRIEELCTDNGLVLFAPLWRKSQLSVLEELARRGIHAMIVSVAAEGLGIEDLGKEIDMEYVEHLRELTKLYGVNPAGEGGEFESFVFSYDQSDKEIRIGTAEKKWMGSYGYLILWDLSIT